MSGENILVVDDEAEVRSLVSGVLGDEGYKTHMAATDQEAFQVIKNTPPDLVLLDLWIGDDGAAGIKILGKIRKMFHEIPVVIMSGHGTIDVAVQAIQNGAVDFIEKPFVIERLLLTVRQGLELQKLRRENSTLRDRKLNVDILSIGKSPFTQSIGGTIEKMAASNCRVFMKCSPGLCADVIALGIHKKSPRRDRPFMAVNCISDEAEDFEAELFGRERAAGYLEKANFGTILLEEVTKLSKSCQRKLLQFLQNNSYSLGNRIVAADVRIICTSGDDVDDLLATERFSQELFYRLNIVGLNITPLKDRREDILPLVNHYLANSEVLFGLKTRKINDEATAILQSYDWPGNIYQLKNVVECSLLNSIDKSEIVRESLPPELTSKQSEKFESLTGGMLISKSIREAKELFEADYLRAQVNRFSGNISKTAKFVGMERSALHRKLNALGIHEKRLKNE
ncbi:MAG: sigma-54 dependent transcriptional regulator [Holosporaceae bacterium]|jgi:two-component system nitrogen regulation response regulator NtrX|nr:sigma-54 dependent transcriptional regulator [Holosporaceae bacterium]